jgi:hypothetical protein
MTKSQWRVINGHFWYTLTARIILRNLGKGCFGINYLFGSFICLQLLNIQSTDNLQLQAFKHIFTSPSSVDLDPKATRSGNARIHGMTRVTTASLAYVATQVRPYFLETWPWQFIELVPDRFDSPYHLRRCFVGRTLQRTPKDFMSLYWNF